jgi:hypothetical protein
MHARLSAMESLAYLRLGERRGACHPTYILLIPRVLISYKATHAIRQISKIAQSGGGANYWNSLNSNFVHNIYLLSRFDVRLQGIRSCKITKRKVNSVIRQTQDVRNTYFCRPRILFFIFCGSHSYRKYANYCHMK